jgi:methyl-accepting chemotaxis protein
MNERFGQRHVISFTSVQLLLRKNKSAAKKWVQLCPVTESIEKIAAISEETLPPLKNLCVTEEMAAQVEEVSASSQSLADLARSLQQVVKRFMLNQA